MHAKSKHLGWDGRLWCNDHAGISAHLAVHDMLVCLPYNATQELHPSIPLNERC